MYAVNKENCSQQDTVGAGIQSTDRTNRAIVIAQGRSQQTELQSITGTADGEQDNNQRTGLQSKAQNRSQRTALQATRCSKYKFASNKQDCRQQ